MFRLVPRLLQSLREQCRARVAWLRLVAGAGTGCVIGWHASVSGRDITLGEGTTIEDGVVLAARPGDHIRVGDRCLLARGAQLHSWGGRIEMGDQCTVHAGVVMYGTGGIKIGNYVRIATGVTLVASMHKFDRLDVPIACQGHTHEGILIADDVWIGARAIILDGVCIGRGAVVGAGAVVTRDVAAYNVVVGVPARVLRSRVAGSDHHHAKPTRPTDTEAH